MSAKEHSQTNVLPTVVTPEIVIDKVLYSIIYIGRKDASGSIRRWSVTRLEGDTR